MPRVPVAERRVETAPLPNARITARTTPETFGASIGQGLGRVDETITKIQEEERRKADQLAVLEADRALGETETSLLYDPAQGALTKRGKDAFAAPETVMQAFDEKVGEIERGLANDTQRLAVRRAATTRRLTIDRALQRHVAAEIRAHDSAETDAYLANETDAGIAAAGDAERVDLAIGRTRAAIADHARRNGLPAEWVKGKVAQTQGKIRGGVIDRLLAAGADRAAKSYYDAHKDEIPGGDRAKLEKALEVGSLRGESQRQADAILAKHDELGAASEAARKIKDPEIRDAVTARVKDYFGIKKAAADEARRETFRSAAQTIEQNGGDLRAIAPTAWIDMEASQRAALETRARQVREGVQPVTNWERYSDLMALASSDTWREFLRVDLMRYRPELADAEFKELVLVQKALRAGKKDDALLAGYRTKKQIVDDAFAAVGLDPVPKKTDVEKREQVAAFRRAVDQRVLDLQARTGKPATPEEIQAIADNLLIQGTVPGSGFGGFFQTERRVFELEPGEQIEVTVDAIPRVEREKIAEALRRHRRPVTDAAIVELFKARNLPGARPAGSGAIGGR